ncbi:MAG TPA: transglycosylase SLT domain-containing protein [Egibacteraceae bacterium]|nr:transglycosylase SLT domain-containing protein [Egibacteraceae bacterium]
MTAPAAVAEVQSRIAAIQARFPMPAAAQRADRGAAFAAALAGAQTTDGLGYVLDPNATPFTPGPSPVASTGPTQAAGGGVDVIAAAKRYLGVPYLWGGTDPNKGLDCSGFVQRVYADLGIDLPRVSRDQARAGTAVASLAQARPGDLIAFGSPVDHIGIYVGDNKMIVAPRRGDVVKIQEVYRTPTAIRRIIDTPAAGASTAPGGTPGPAAYAGLFRAAESRHGLPAGLLNAVAKHESGYNPNAVSPAGARGLMQFMPATARELGIDPMVPSQAIDGAARYLSSNLRRFGSVELAVAAYNAGPGAVARHNGVPPYAETRTYVQRVLGTLRGARA